MVNNYNLNIPRYLDSFEPAEPWDIHSIMFGGIPNMELDTLNEYWDAFPGLRKELFREITPEYVKVCCENLEQEIINSSATAKYKEDFRKAFDGFQESLSERLLRNYSSINSQDEEEKISNDIFKRLESIKAIDPYAAFQILDKLIQSVIVLTLTASAEDFPAGTYTVTEAGYNSDTLAYQWDASHSWIKSDKLPSDQSALINTEQYGKVNIDVPVGVNVTDGNYTTAVNLLNSYVVRDIKATKVWNDLGLENADHPSVSMTLFRTDRSGNKASVSTQIIGANQTGDNLTLTWRNQLSPTPIL